MSKQQRLIFIISLEKNGQVAVKSEFHPQIVTGDAVKALPDYMRHFQHIAVSIAQGVKASLHNAMGDDKNALVQDPDPKPVLEAENGEVYS